MGKNSGGSLPSTFPLNAIQLSSWEYLSLLCFVLDRWWANMYWGVLVCKACHHALFPQRFVFYCTLQPAPLDLRLFVIYDCSGIVVVVTTRNHVPLDLPTCPGLLMTESVHLSAVRCKLSAWRHGLQIKSLIDLWGDGKWSWIKTFYCSPLAFLFTKNTVPS